MRLLNIILHLLLALTITARNSIDLIDGADLSVEYTYDGNGNLTSDANKGISLIEYDDVNMPRRIQFANGNKIEYVYTAEGKKLRTIYYTASTEQKDSTEYLLGGLLTKKNNNLDKYLYDGGYYSFDNNTPTSHYYNRDHLGNIREVISQTGDIEQVTHYYPFGTPYSDSSVTNPALQPYKYNGKEFDAMHGLHTYDYGARQYDPLLAVWHGVDPLCEKDYGTGTNVYCRNNPLRFVDVDGKRIIGLSIGSHGDIIIGEDATKDVQRIAIAMMGTSTGTRMLKNMVESKTTVDIILSPETCMGTLPNGIEVTYAETVQGNYDKNDNYGQYIAYGQYRLKVATIKLYLGSIEWSTKEKGNDNYGLSTDEVIGIEAGHEAVHATDIQEIDKDKKYEQKYRTVRPDREDKPNMIEEKIRKEIRDKKENVD